MDLVLCYLPWSSIQQEVHGTSPRGLCLWIETSELHAAMREHFLLVLSTGTGEHDEET
jgi:hypothetical protein